MSLLVVCEWPVLNIYLGDIDKQFRRVSFCQLLSSRLDQYRVSALELVTTLVVLPGFITYKLSNNRPGTLTCNRQRKHHDSVFGSLALSIRVGTVEEHIGRATSALVVESSACSSDYSLADACVQICKKFVACTFIL